MDMDVDVEACLILGCKSLPTKISLTPEHVLLSFDDVDPANMHKFALEDFACMRGVLHS